MENDKENNLKLKIKKKIIYQTNLPDQPGGLRRIFFLLFSLQIERVFNRALDGAIHCTMITNMRN